MVPVVVRRWLFSAAVVLPGIALHAIYLSGIPADERSGAVAFGVALLFLGAPMSLVALARPETWLWLSRAPEGVNEQRDGGDRRTDAAEDVPSAKGNASSSVYCSRKSNDDKPGLPGPGRQARWT